MKKKVCAVLLSLCSLIGGAERSSNASVIGKILKYGSAAVGSLDTLNTIVVLSHWVGLRMYELFGGPHKMDPWSAGFGLIGNTKADDLKNKYLIYSIDDRHDIRVLTPFTLFADLICYGGYKLGQYLDKEKENEKSNINSGKEDSKKTVPDKDKKPTLNENSKKSKV